MRTFKFIFVLCCFVAGMSIPFYGFSSPVLYLTIATAFFTIRTRYQTAKNKGQWDNRITPNELLTWGLVIVIIGATLCMIVIKNIQSQQGEWYETEDGGLTNVDPEWEKRKLEEYNLFKEDAILLGRWEPADSSITDAKYMWGRSDVLIYKKNELYFIEYENTGFAKNYIEQGIPAPNGNVIIFTTYHFFYPESLTFKDDTYIRKD